MREDLREDPKPLFAHGRATLSDPNLLGGASNAKPGKVHQQTGVFFGSWLGMRVDRHDFLGDIINSLESVQERKSRSSMNELHQVPGDSFQRPGSPPPNPP